MKTGRIMAVLVIALIGFLSFILRNGSSAGKSGTAAKLILEGDARGLKGGDPVFFQGVLVGRTVKPVIEGRFIVIGLALNSSAPNGLPLCTEFETAGSAAASSRLRSLTGRLPGGRESGGAECKANIFAMKGEAALVSEYWTWQLERSRRP